MGAWFYLFFPWKQFVKKLHRFQRVTDQAKLENSVLVHLNDEFKFLVVTDRINYMIIWRNCDCSRKPRNIMRASVYIAVHRQFGRRSQTRMLDAGWQAARWRPPREAGCTRRHTALSPEPKVGQTGYIRRPTRQEHHLKWAGWIVFTR